MYNSSSINHVDKDSIKQGTWITKDSIGLTTIVNYKNGVLNGKCIVYHSNGQIAVIGKYKKGEKNKQWKWYLSNGNIASMTKYRKGKIVRKTMINTVW